MSAQDDLDAIVRDLQRQYLADAPARLAEIADTLAALAAGDETAPVQLKVLFHRLKGSSGSYGFADVAAVAAELDRRAAAALAPTDAEALREAMRTVDQLFARHIAAFGAAAAAPAALHVLLLADPQAGDAGLGAALTAAGLTVTGATSVAAAAARLEAGAADLLLTAPGVAAADVRALARALGNLPAAQRVPLVVSAAASDVAARAAALRDGANDQVPWPTDTGALVALLQARAARAKG